ncbi:MAG TPA: 2-oxoacid:ferredoxin oxidoreductase subunit beta [Acidobacteriota bacterium]|nr:2-oxoacid:ferredoxin oxidoreductase subunit beta [Acidobacteriota bacterium]
MSTIATPQPLTRKDFESDQEIRWCPGCGDYSILAQTQKVLPELDVPREKFVFVSGIGCSSRFPYYVNTYGFHSIHGRAPAIATGVKASRPDLYVWVVTGDGDGLSIGGNHLIHCMRRNVDLKIILFNNRIYGLTKGQYSPTSEFGKKTKSTPMGSIDYPVNPIHLAIAAEATFVARSFDIDTKHLQEILVRAAKHKGTAFVEVFQNCNIFNDGAFKGFTDKEVRDDKIVYVQHGKPLVYGKNRDKGLRLNGTNLEVVTLGNGVTEADLLVYNEEDRSPVMSYLVSALEFPHFPVPVGVFRNIHKPTYDELMESQIHRSEELYGKGDLEKLLNAGDTWVVD